MSLEFLLFEKLDDEETCLIYPVAFISSLLTGVALYVKKRIHRGVFKRLCWAAVTRPN